MHFRPEIISINYFNPKTCLSKNEELINEIAEMIKNFSNFSCLFIEQFLRYNLIKAKISYSKASLVILLKLLSDAFKI